MDFKQRGEKKENCPGPITGSGQFFASIGLKKRITLSLVAPITCSSPRASTGFRMFRPFHRIDHARLRLPREKRRPALLSSVRKAEDSFVLASFPPPFGSRPNALGSQHILVSNGFGTDFFQSVRLVGYSLVGGPFFCMLYFKNQNFKDQSPKAQTDPNRRLRLRLNGTIANRRTPV